MKNNFKNNYSKLVVTSAAILTGTLMTTTLAGCLQKDFNNGSDITNTSDSNNPIGTTSEDISANISSITPEETEVYDFAWEFDETIDFEKYVNKKFSISLTNYVFAFGFTDELNKAYTDFINSRFNKNYKSVPFKKANYFFDYINGDIKTHHKYREYKRFKTVCLNGTYCMKSAFNNKLIISYLIQNNIKLGDHVEIDNLKSIIGNEIYTYDITYKNLISNEKMGNYEYSYKYTKYNLAELLRQYNESLYNLCIDESIKDTRLLLNYEACKVYNELLKQFYGEKAFQLGQVPTRGQYIAIFGEEPLDLSYIPGAVIVTYQEQMSNEDKINDSLYEQYIPIVNQETGQVYGIIDYPNYNVFYKKPEQSEQDTGRSR